MEIWFRDCNKANSFEEKIEKDLDFGKNCARIRSSQSYREKDLKIVEPSVELIWITPNPEKVIEEAGRTCYKSEDLITEESSSKFIRGIMKSGHESVIEHCSASFRLVMTRFSSHQLVRHRLFSYSQESQRYCNYTKDKLGNEITFVKPLHLKKVEEASNEDIWYFAMKQSEQAYFNLINNGCKPEIARSVLPSSTKTEIVCTGNFRNWRHFLKLRTDLHAQEDIRYLAQLILEQLYKIAPTVFQDICEKVAGENK